tara:strand:- start:499 stop:777 length:279 start_codon:yes stop_codon:yes gene_type:complete
MKEHKWTWADYIDGGPNLDQRLIKIAKLLKRMRAWENKNGDMPMDSPNGIMFGKDMDFVNNIKLGLSGMLNNNFQFDKKMKIILNKIWRRYA